MKSFKTLSITAFFFIVLSSICIHHVSALTVFSSCRKQLNHPNGNLPITMNSNDGFKGSSNSFFFMSLHMSNAQQETEEQKSSKLPFLLDPGTKGGAVFLSIVLFFIPLIGYQVATTALGIDEVEAGKWIGVGFTVVSLLLWAASYIFRVATKDMTYAKQLKDYENAVIAKRLEELDSDEVQALLEDIERDKF